MEAESERCLEAPRPAAALVVTFHTVLPMPHCLTCLSVPARALTTSAAPPEIHMTPSAALLEKAAPKPKVFLQGVTPSSLLSQQVGLRICSSTPRLSVFLIAQTSRKYSLFLKTVFSVPARSSLTLKGLMILLERGNWHVSQRNGSRRVWNSLQTRRRNQIIQKHVTLVINAPLMFLVLATRLILKMLQLLYANVLLITSLLV